ncbi:MAG: hypothetical protein ACQES9_11035 [Myxococcota bacterium]
MKKLILIPLFLFSFIFAACTTDDEDDAIITCNTYDDWLYACDSYCTMSYSCEDEYLALPVGDKILLDECADGPIYEASLAPAICEPTDAEWTSDLAACIGYGEDLLGMVCDYPAYCGDGVCDADEDIDTCPEDCGPVCGDGYCEGDEDAWTCVEDCGVEEAELVCDNYAVWVTDFGCEDTSSSYDCTLPSTEPLCEDLIYDEFDFAATSDEVYNLQICAEELALEADTCSDYEYATDMWCSDLLINIVGVECTEEYKKKK